LPFITTASGPHGAPASRILAFSTQTLCFVQFNGAIRGVLFSSRGRRYIVKRTLILAFWLVLFLTSCAAPEETPLPPAAAKPVDPFPLPTERGDYFVTSGVCATCHKNMVDEAGNDISIDTFWRATMMANSSRDPYWQASVRGEVISNPDYDKIIQDKCTTCHIPMARTTRVIAGGTGVALDDGFLNMTNELHDLGIDGISCTLCHQIEPTNLGTEESYDGHYVIDESKPKGERVSYGPYATSETDTVVMKSASGFIPIEGDHIQNSELCGSCHTLYTPTVDNDGEVAGIFPEQMPYIEWLASDYADSESCQDCHMPEAAGDVVLSVTGSPARENFSAHSFAGGNIYAISLLQNYAAEIGVTASENQFDAALQRAKTQLEEQTASIKVEQIELDGTHLIVRVQVESQVGGPFPSGFPSRRVWLHFKVEDSGGNVVFESGGWSTDGSINGNDNDLDDLAFEPHYEVIDTPDQVQIYEAIMGDVDGAVTTTLLRGAVYLKDNRLLPDGFDKDSVSEDIAVNGAALQDPDFEAAGDEIVCNIDVGESAGPFTMTVELLYQSIGYRWAQNLKRFDAPEPEKFLAYYANVSNAPTVVAAETITVE
jgi:hypothetical protein